MIAGIDSSTPFFMSLIRSKQQLAENGQKEIKQFQSCGLVLQRLLYRLISLDACLLAFLSARCSIEVQILSLLQS